MPPLISSGEALHSYLFRINHGACERAAIILQFMSLLVSMPFKWRNRFQYYSFEQQKPCCLFIVNKQHPFAIHSTSFTANSQFDEWKHMPISIYFPFAEKTQRYGDLSRWGALSRTCILDMPSESCLFQFKFSAWGWSSAMLIFLTFCQVSRISPINLFRLSQGNANGWNWHFLCPLSLLF